VVPVGLALVLATGVPDQVDAAERTGLATWYCSDGRDGSRRSDCTRGYGPDSHVAAIDTADTPFRKGDRVAVRGPAGVTVVTIVDVCACKAGRIIDLPIGVFQHVVGSWTRGYGRVTVSDRSRTSGTTPRPTLPPTDTAGGWVGPVKDAIPPRRPAREPVYPLTWPMCWVG
jgi:hypothetical protein